MAKCRNLDSEFRKATYLLGGKNLKTGNQGKVRPENQTLIEIQDNAWTKLFLKARRAVENISIAEAEFNSASEKAGRTPHEAAQSFLVVADCYGESCGHCVKHSFQR